MFYFFQQKTLTLDYKAQTQNSLCFTTLLALLCWGCLGCGDRSLKPRQLAFYHWRTVWRPTQAECEWLDSLGCQKLYIKCLDIARSPESGAIEPYARLETADTVGLSGRVLVPAVFIANGVFQNITTPDLDALAEKTAHAVADATRRWPPSAVSPYHQPGWREIQFDCDWTASTRGAFFEFLKIVRPLLPAGTQLSATIRLHQYKFPQQTGVPPVDRGMLMLYNTGDLENPDAGHSIFSLNDARKYAPKSPYPRPLDVALPLFSWALVYRSGTLWKIIPEMGDLAQNQCLEPAPISPTEGLRYFQVKCGTFVGGHYLRPGDWVREETVTPALLSQALDFARQLPLDQGGTIAFFALDTFTWKRFEDVRM